METKEMMKMMETIESDGKRWTTMENYGKLWKTWKTWKTIGPAQENGGKWQKWWKMVEKDENN